jgi:hypothetical protein
MPRAPYDPEKPLFGFANAETFEAFHWLTFDPEFYDGFFLAIARDHPGDVAAIAKDLREYATVGVLQDASDASRQEWVKKLDQVRWEPPLLQSGQSGLRPVVSRHRSGSSLKHGWGRADGGSCIEPAKSHRFPAL